MRQFLTLSFVITEIAVIGAAKLHHDNIALESGNTGGRREIIVQAPHSPLVRHQQSRRIGDDVPFQSIPQNGAPYWWAGSENPFNHVSCGTNCGTKSQANVGVVSPSFQGAKPATALTHHGPLNRIQPQSHVATPNNRGHISQSGNRSPPIRGSPVVLKSPEVIALQIANKQLTEQVLVQQDQLRQQQIDYQRELEKQIMILLKQRGNNNNNRPLSHRNDQERISELMGPMGICPTRYICVHWQLCSDGFVIADGSGFIDKTIGPISTQVSSSYESCGGDMICCGIPESVFVEDQNFNNFGLGPPSHSQHESSPNAPDFETQAINHNTPFNHKESLFLPDEHSENIPFHSTAQEISPINIEDSSFNSFDNDQFNPQQETQHPTLSEGAPIKEMNFNPLFTDHQEGQLGSVPLPFPETGIILQLSPPHLDENTQNNVAFNPNINHQDSLSSGFVDQSNFQSHGVDLPLVIPGHIENLQGSTESNFHHLKNQNRQQPEEVLNSFNNGGVFPHSNIPQPNQQFKEMPINPLFTDHQDDHAGFGGSFFPETDLVLDLIPPFNLPPQLVAQFSNQENPSFSNHDLHTNFEGQTNRHYDSNENFVAFSPEENFFSDNQYEHSNFSPGHQNLNHPILTNNHDRLQSSGRPNKFNPNNFQGVVKFPHGSNEFSNSNFNQNGQGLFRQSTHQQHAQHGVAGNIISPPLITPLGTPLTGDGGMCSASSYCVLQQECNPFNGFIVMDPSEIEEQWKSGPTVPRIRCIVPGGVQNGVCCQLPHPIAGVHPIVEQNLNHPILSNNHNRLQSSGRPNNFNPNNFQGIVKSPHGSNKFSDSKFNQNVQGVFRQSTQQQHAQHGAAGNIISPPLITPLGTPLIEGGGICSASSYCVLQQECNPFNGFIVMDPNEIEEQWTSGSTVSQIGCFVPDGSQHGVCCQLPHPIAGVHPIVDERFGQ